jgi:hypothetical protein
MHLEQRDLHNQLRRESIATRDRIAAQVRPIDPAKLNEHPEPKGWSVAQVLEHLCRADEQYLHPVLDILRAARPDAAAPIREWSPTFIGGKIAGALLNPKPIKFGPPSFRPGPTPRNAVLEAFLETELRFQQVMDEAASYDWRALRIHSPALPRFVPKMNLGDAFRIHVVHVTRHSRQIERLVQQL